MPRSRSCAMLAMLVSLTLLGKASADPFTAGNVVVYRVGEIGGGSLTNAGNPVFLDEYTPTGTLVQSFPIPSTGTERLIAGGTASSEGLLSLSTNGQYLVLTGYAASPGDTTNLTGSSASSVNRAIGRVEVSTGSYMRTNALTDFASGDNPRSVASDDGSRFWVAGGKGGVRYVANVGASSSTQLSTTVTNLNQVNIFDGQLYVSTGSGATSIRLGTVGEGLPTASGQTITSLNGFSTSGNPHGFFMADLDSGVAGVDTLYVADETVGVVKYSLVDDVWTSNGMIGSDAENYRGLTAAVAGADVTLFAIRKGGSGASGGGELVTLTDSSGYNGTFTGSFALLATASTNTAFRGVVYITAVPEPGSLALAGLALLLASAAYVTRKTGW